MQYPCTVDKSRFGYEYLDTVKKNGIFYCYHPGTDFNYGKTAWADYGGEVRAISDGVCVYSAYATGWGNLVVLYHAKYNIYSRHGHLSGRGVVKDQVVPEGYLIGQIGNTGNSSGPHLHFDLPKTQMRWTSYTRLMSKDQVIAQYANPIEFIEGKMEEEAKAKEIAEIYLHNWQDKDGKNISKESWEWITKNNNFVSLSTHPQEQMTYERFAIVLKRIQDPLNDKLEELEKKLDKLYSKIK